MNTVRFVIVALLLSSSAFAGSLSADLKDYFADIAGVQVQELGKTVLVSGDAGTWEQVQRIQRTVEVLAEKGEPVASTVQLSKSGVQALVEQMERQIGSPAISVTRMGGTYVLEGHAVSEFEADRAVEVVRMLLGMKQMHARGLADAAPATDLRIADLMRVAQPKQAAKKKLK